jgi:hypothetical protein
LENYTKDDIKDINLKLENILNKAKSNNMFNDRIQTILINQETDSLCELHMVSPEKNHIIDQISMKDSSLLSPIINEQINNQ